MPSNIDYFNTKLEIDKKIHEIEKKRNEDSKLIEDLRKKMEEMKKKLNEMNNQILANKNILQIKECDEKTKGLANKIKAQVEKIINIELPIYEPIGFKKELKDGQENYVIKVHIGGQKYIHISASVKVKNGDIELEVLSGKRLNDPL